MADLVQKHLENYASDLEELRRSGLYDNTEIKYITKQCNSFEYKINNSTKSVDAYTEYITFEKLLLKQIQERRKSKKVFDKRSLAETNILKKIKNIYGIALQRFPTNFKLYLSFFKFCKQYNFISPASVAVQNMTKNYSQNPEAWRIAASWYAHDQKDLNGALKILNKGLILHRDSKVLYTEAIKLELSAADGSEEDESTLRTICQRIETYIRFICESISDVSYLIEILDFLESHSFTTSVQNFIIGKLLEMHSDKKSVWHALAEREKRGLHYNTNNEEMQESGKSQLCFNKYRQGLETVSSSEKAGLWSMYLDCLIELQDENNELSSQEKNKLLMAALEQASKEGYLIEKYYIKWLELVNDDEALTILTKATTNLPDSVDLWKLRLRYVIMTGKNVKVDETFKEGVEVLKKSSLALWFMYIRYCSLLSRDDVIDETYRRGVKQSPEISQALKPKYVEWLALSKGINEARTVYNSLANELPYCKELHLTMSKLESTEIDFNFEVWSRVHELACRQFGKDDVDVWINRISFYLHFNKTANVNEIVQRIYREAENTLCTLLQSDFREKYTNLLHLDSIGSS